MIMKDCEKVERQQAPICGGGSGTLPELNMNLNSPDKNSDNIYLKREKQSPPCLNPPKHPHGNSPPTPTHPHSGQHRVYTYGNDNSSMNRQTRVQSTRPDPIPGAPYAGASAQRLGSAMLRRYQPSRSSGIIANQANWRY